MDILKILRGQGQESTLLVYTAVDRPVDPFEKTTKQDFLGPVSVPVIVTPISFTALKWKFWGQVPAGSIQVIADKKYYDLFLASRKIIYQGNNYYTWQDDSKRFTIIVRQDYLVAVLGRKYD